MRDIDLHLLNIFDAIMSEGSMTRAAQRLALSQPAVSNAVVRMRQLWNDPLFIKDGRGIKPTPKALELWAGIGAPLTAIRAAGLPAPFDPASAQRRFRLSVNDFITYPVWPRLRRVLEAQAPGIDILAVPWHIHDTRQILVDNEVDLAMSGAAVPGAEIRQQAMFDAHYICAMREDHPLAGTALGMADFLAADHLLVSLSGNPVGLIDDLLEQRGVRRRVAMTINNFYGLVDLLLVSDLICVMSDNFFRHHPLSQHIHRAAIPFEVPSNNISLAWHRRHESDAGHRWLRELLIPMCRELFA
ncbi:LysR family transcriptional regulator [Janthinobacterium agaricidamnosum]|uniref:Bacterial regulatory helix-turn-helix, lysR family protein n=1 Tax=Janthinobacterium agaricidamnosum NBRC 102515 = DSM 9628 TaxID=1349767 RepID=W0VAW8_9BURK|nr:LysR family transcriptional regulator [Janthinobacterium agaricidamnosum]CDG84493.1 bacterial regulatory helix-turn-helix, lysR family protein [Janthinobacterium agaricidamnosum NBRC 102515 = DSM 9628]